MTRPLNVIFNCLICLKFLVFKQATGYTQSLLTPVKILSVKSGLTSSDRFMSMVKKAPYQPYQPSGDTTQLTANEKTPAFSRGEEITL